MRFFISLVLLLGSGCGPAIETTGYELAPCDLGISDLSPDEPVDYIGFTELGGYFGSGMLVEEGTACSTAADEETCLAAVEELPTEKLMTEPASDLVLVTTDGDVVNAYVSVDEVVGFLGEIETSGEAVQVARWSGYEFSCDSVESGGVKEVDDGYELIAVEYLQRCGPEKSQQVHLHVAADGSVEVLETTSRPNESSPCP